MLELLFSLLLQLSVLQSGGPISETPSSSGNKPTTIESTKIGSGGWDDKNYSGTSTNKKIGSGGWDDKN